MYPLYEPSSGAYQGEPSEAAEAGRLHLNGGYAPRSIWLAGDVLGGPGLSAEVFAAASHFGNLKEMTKGLLKKEFSFREEEEETEQQDCPRGRPCPFL